MLMEFDRDLEMVPGCYLNLRLLSILGHNIASHMVGSKYEGPTESLEAYSALYRRVGESVAKHRPYLLEKLADFHIACTKIEVPNLEQQPRE